MILDDVISIQRLTPDSTNANKESYQINAALSAVAVNLQPATAEDVAISEGVFGQTYIGFTTESGIKEGDFVTVSGSNQQLRVKGIEDWSKDPIPHFELTLVSFAQEATI
mgnify:CR=1 FL=1